MAPEQFGFNNFNDFDFNLDDYYSDYSTPLKIQTGWNWTEKRVSVAPYSNVDDMSSPVVRGIVQMWFGSNIQTHTNTHKHARTSIAYGDFFVFDGSTKR